MAPRKVATTTSPKLRANGNQQWHQRQPHQRYVPMAPSNGTQKWQLRQPRQSCVRPRQSCVPMAPQPLEPRNGSYDNLAKGGTQHWHPGMAATAARMTSCVPMAPCRNGSYDNLAKVAPQWRPQQWNPGMAATTTSPKVAPSNGTQEWQLRQPRQRHPGMALRQPRQSCVPAPPLIGSKNPYSRSYLVNKYNLSWVPKRENASSISTECRQVTSILRKSDLDPSVIDR